MPIHDSADAGGAAYGENGMDAAALDPHQLMRDLGAYKESRLVRSGWELAATLFPYLVLTGIMLFAVEAGYFSALVLAPLAALFLLRLFAIQHDCGHGSFLPTRSGNDWLGRALGILTLTPYDCWRHSHARHHAATGNLDARGAGDVDTLTVQEFNGRSRPRRVLYRLYRHPLVLLGLGPAYLFLLRHRLPIGLMREGWIFWASALATNAAIVLIVAALVMVFGAVATVLVLLPVVLMTASVGVWLFYVQHQFEGAHWDRKASWSFHDAALHGSTYLDLPVVLRWFTANIGVHHVHHLASRIPFYRFPEVLKAHPRLRTINRYTMFQTFGTLRLALWDEGRRRLVSFREASRT